MYKHKETGKLYQLANHDTMADLIGLDGETLIVSSRKFNEDFEYMEPPAKAEEKPPAKTEEKPVDGGKA